MESFIEPLKELKEYKELKHELPKMKGIVQVSGCIDTQKPHFIYGLLEGEWSGLIVTFQEQKARELYESYRFFDRNAVYYPAKDVLFYQSGAIC